MTLFTLIATFANFSGGSLASIDPGPLSTIHQGFTQDAGCGVCHAAHDLDGLAWFTSAFIHQDNTGQCLQCHGFDGRDRSAHNAALPERHLNPTYNAFAIYGDWKMAVAFNDNGNVEVGQIATQLNLDIDYQFTGTERIHAFVQPLNQGGNFTPLPVLGR